MKQGNDLTKPITIYDSGGNVTKKLVFTDDFDKSRIINPLLSWAEYLLLIFNYLGENKKYYKAVIDEKKKHVGYILKRDKQFRYESWPEHIMTLPTVDFNADENPLRNQPNEHAGLVKAPKKVEFYYPKQVVGDWLKVVWDTPRKGVGWVKWKDKHNDLLIERFYVM